ncbi:transposase [Aquibacillus koreensis]|uniref:Transposase n=1 Tax=Aquibacillus koreensis TaxID=279446 RepID=A0A9X3WMQ0_9BACI|nr:transposase [Aquibacillus koreensis]MCT2536076.1 transposase [Aquibacillus koreensis]MDC3422597.1 transposase [Aquibacillus koreensis]
MPRQARRKSNSGIYHVMLRGANRQEIFHDEEDCITFLDTVRAYKEKSSISVFSWCLMNNHVHLLLKEGDESLSETMKRIGVSYVWYYNLKYDTTGHLFQDRFRSEVVEDRRSFLAVIRYIHRNPLKAGIASHLGDWQWSSFTGIMGEYRYPRDLLDRDFVLQAFSNDKTIARNKFKAFCEKQNDEESLDEKYEVKKRLTDVDARNAIREMLCGVEIAQVKSMPRIERNKILYEIKVIKGLSQRQASRIFGVSASLINKVQSRQ